MGSNGASLPVMGSSQEFQNISNNITYLIDRISYDYLFCKCCNLHLSEIAADVFKAQSLWTQYARYLSVGPFEGDFPCLWNLLCSGKLGK